MNEDDKRLITEWLGELFHKKTDYVTASGEWCICNCGYAYIKPENHQNRPFDASDWPSLGQIKEKIVREGKWEVFLAHFGNLYCDPRVIDDEASVWDVITFIVDSFTTPATFFPLVVEAIKEGVI